MANKKSSKKKKKHGLLKKVARGIYTIISKLYNVIDKLIITPVAKLMLKSEGLFKNTNQVFDRLLNIKGVLIVIDFDDEKEAHEFMRKKGYGRDEYDIAYEYSVWPKDEDWVCGCTLGFTKKQTRESLNKCLEHYNLKLLANGKVKEL